MCKILNAVERHSKMGNTGEGNKNLMNKKGATEHCSWGQRLHFFQTQDF